MPKTFNHRLLLGFIATATAGIVMLAVFDPATSGVFPPCPVWYLTGWYCPGCGSLRAIHQLLHGNLQAAWAMNPLMILLLPFVGYGLTSHAVGVIRGRGLPQLFLPAAWIQALGGVIIVYGIVRNLPFHPFNLLAPGAMLGL
jgi:hypothetical protein